MNRPRKAKSILLFAGLALGISALIAVTALAHTSGTAGHVAANVSSAEISQTLRTAAGSLTDRSDPETAASNIDRGSTVTLHKKTARPSASTEQKKAETANSAKQKTTGTTDPAERETSRSTGSAASGTAAAKSAQDSHSSTQESYSPAQGTHSSTKKAAQSGKAPASEKSVVNTNQSAASDEKGISTAARASDASAHSKAETPSAPAQMETKPSPAAAKETAASDAYSGKELDLLARLICAEAQGESYDAKVAVGAVVINRVQSGLFANSIADVIYQNIDGYWQFTPVANGWIDKPADSESVSAAKDALNGADPTDGALWYYDDSTTNQFLLAKKVAVKLDHMIFAY